jgi:hypothetical protein
MTPSGAKYKAQVDDVLKAYGSIAKSDMKKVRGGQMALLFQVLTVRSLAMLHYAYTLLSGSHTGTDVCAVCRPRSNSSTTSAQPLASSRTDNRPCTSFATQLHATA